MPKAYWVAHVDVTNPDQYAVYRDLAPIAFEKYGARYLARGGAFEVMEGDRRERHVVIEFPSLQAAKDCYHSPEYQKAKAEREGAGIANITLVEGVE